MGYCVKLNSEVKFFFDEQLSKKRDKQIIKDIYLLTSKQSTSTAWFSLRKGVITASAEHHILSKLNSKTLLRKIKASINLYAKKTKKSKSLEWATSKKKIALKIYIRKNKLPHVNFHCQESGLYMSEVYP